jgi:hypothetical protein
METGKMEKIKFKHIGLGYCLFIAGVMAGYAWAYYHMHAHTYTLVPYYNYKPIEIRDRDKWSLKNLTLFLPDHVAYPVDY